MIAKFRSSRTGQFVTKVFAYLNPWETEREEAGFYFTDVELTMVRDSVAGFKPGTEHYEKLRLKLLDKIDAELAR